ncbi:MAG: hypothetical protein B2I17_02305 [Thermoplasmatales archaeon B_DKE]|nr:MAG: hypothetical protein B2I17_02305 [Thermoplasmatales archaeon B_DKE]QRF75559.1 hypothetical protein Thermo_01063 [Thermoplasmatales archaeon]
MAKTVSLSDYDERRRFEIRLQVSLRSNAIKIKAQSKHPERFDEYILQRDQKIRELIGSEGQLEIFENGIKIYP